MLATTVKTFLMYGLILAGGLAAGRYVPQVARMVMPNYTEGNFSAYYPDPKTQVAVFGTASCQYCIATRNYLNAHHIAFADLDVNKSDKAKRDFTQLGGKAVPVILIGNRQLVGFNQSAVEAALEKIHSPTM